MTNRERQLRAELDQLRARYDGGAVSPAIHATIRDIETEIAWLHQRHAQHHGGALKC